MENKNSQKDYVSKLKPSVNSRSRKVIFGVLLFTFLIFIYLSTVKTNFSWFSDLTINLAAGCISSIVTVFVIDFLINKEKKLKLIAINKLDHHGLLTYIRILMIKIMNDLDYVSKEDMFSYMDNAEEKFNKFINDPKIISKLENLSQLSQNNILFIRKINATLEKGWKYLAKNMKDFKPYPDPILVHKINIEMSYISGVISAGEKLFTIYFDKLPEKISRKRMDEMLPGMTVLWKIVSEGLEDPSRSYKNCYLNSFNFLMELGKRCQKENIFFNI